MSQPESSQQENSQESTVYDKISEKFFGVKYNTLVDYYLPDSSMMDISETPPYCKYFLLVTFYAGLIVLFGYFAFQQYKLGRTQTFVSLQKDAGVCHLNPSQSTCCEVPLSVTGKYLGDIHGIWDTESKFSYVDAAYGVTLQGLTYTNEEWTYIMNKISSKVLAIGEKGKLRDYSWNLVSWDAFTAEDTTHGLLRFYSTGHSGMTYNKQINDIVYGSKDENCGFYYDWTASFDPSSATLDVSINVNVSFDGEYTCSYENSQEIKSYCLNLCPQTFSFKQFGKDPASSTTNTLDISIDLDAVSTALAVNYNLTSLEHLNNIPNDPDRIVLFNQMNSSKSIEPNLINLTSSYYDFLYAPTTPIYCTKFDDPSITVPACFVRIGNTLTYAVTTEWGHYANKNSKAPKRCVYPLENSSSVKYYCNNFDIIIGLIYYPNPCTSTSSSSNVPTNHPTYSPINYNFYYHSNLSESVAYHYGDSDFVPFNKPCVDNGLIIEFAKAAAKAISLDVENGDKKVPDSANYAQGKMTKTGIFDSSCFFVVFIYSSMFVPSGCALLAVEFYGGYDKAISDYYFQPSLAKNPFSNAEALHRLSMKPPTQLIQSYYSCVLSTYDSIIQATGIAFGNASLYVSIGIAMLIFSIKVFFEYVKRDHMKSKLEMEEILLKERIDEKKSKENLEKFIKKDGEMYETFKNEIKDEIKIEISATRGSENDQNHVPTPQNLPNAGSTEHIQGPQETMNYNYCAIL